MEISLSQSEHLDLANQEENNGIMLAKFTQLAKSNPQYADQKVVVPITDKKPLFATQRINIKDVVTEA